MELGQSVLMVLRNSHSPVNAIIGWRQIESALKKAGACVLFLDFDGTLAEIVDNPGEAVPAPGVAGALAELQELSGMNIAVISGRPITDIRSRVGLDVFYAGNHGLEIEGPGIRYVVPAAAKLARRIELLCDGLGPIISSIPGTLIERKGLSASVHYRKTPAEREADVAAAVLQAAEAYSGGVEVRQGKKVLELRPRVPWGKGSAARAILEAVTADAGALPVCFGDDATDEDLFREFPHGVTVRVGEDNGPTAANYFVRDVSQSVQLLGRIARTWADKIRAGL